MGLSGVFTDEKDIRARVVARQGGSSTDWTSPGSNNYSYTFTTVFIQTGMIAGSSSADVTVTFPIAYSQKPHIQATMNSSVNATGMAVVNSATTTTASLRSYSHDGNRYVDNICWTA